MGRRQALAGAASQDTLGRIHTPASGRAVLRRTRDHARSQSPPGAAQRREPAPVQLLSTPAARTRRQDPDEKRERSLLPASRRVQPAGGDPARQRKPQGSRAVLLPQPHRIQWTVPLQSKRKVQRTVRTLWNDTLHNRFQAIRRAALAMDLHRRRLRVDRGIAQRLHLRRPALRCPVPRVRERRLRLGRTGTPRGMARPAPWSGSGVESGHGSNRGAVPRPRVQGGIPRRPRKISRTGDRSPAREILATRNIE